jgi:hypothetical protein
MLVIVCSKLYNHKMFCLETNFEPSVKTSFKNDTYLWRDAFSLRHILLAQDQTGSSHHPKDL